MSQSVTLSNILANKVRIDKKYGEDIYYICLDINENILGRLSATVTVTNKALPVVWAPSYGATFHHNNNYKRVDTIIRSTHPVILEYDFLPRPFPGQSVESAQSMHLLKGVHEAKKFIGLETFCSCVCDVTFHNITLTETYLDGVAVYNMKFESITSNVISNILVNGIGIATGCPNYG